MDKTISTFQVSIYGNLEKYNQTISKGRCRIFYKYENRNGTYITDEFAEKLISSLPYTPVKGIYDSFNDDYTDHGSKRTEGRIYGIVPENPNFSWESHLDEDGKERVYACCDVFIFTAIYGEEASSILEKSESMELYDKSIQGSWQVLNGKKYFVFEEGCFLGLQALGEDVEPCFEGAAFYSLDTDGFKQFLKNLEYKLEQIQMEEKDMPGINFKLSDSAKHNAIFSILNPTFNEEGNWIVQYSICDVYDQYAVCYDHENGGFVRAYYEKDDSNDSLKINSIEKCFIVDVNETEKAALDILQTINGGTYEKIDENYQKIVDDYSTLNEQFTANSEELTNATNKISEISEKIEEYCAANTTLNTEKQELESKIAEYSNTVEELQRKCEELTEFKKATLQKQKENIISSYSEKLSKEVLDTFYSSLEDFSIDSLERELAYTYVKSNPELGKIKNPIIPKEKQLTGIEYILETHKKN